MKHFCCYVFDCPVPGGPFAGCPIKACRGVCACGAEEEEEEEHNAPGGHAHHYTHAPFMSLFIGGHVGAHGLMKVVRIWMLIVAIYISAVSILCVATDYDAMVVNGERGGTSITFL